MKTAAIIAATLALATSALAAPTPRSTIQTQIQTLEIQILTVINDLVQSNSNLLGDYNAGTSQYATLVNELQGPQPCAPFVPGNPATKNQAIRALQTSQSELMQLSLDLQNPALKIGHSDFHADVCSAYDYYAAVSKFVGA